MLRAVVWALALCSGVCAGDWSSLYGGVAIENERARLSGDLKAAIAQEIQPFLTDSQAHEFSKLTIESPAAAEPDPNPLDFHSSRAGVITLPLLTVAFVEDMSTAYAWLWANRYSSRTADEYFGMLANRAAKDFPEGRYPAPLVALHVPADALRDPVVAKMALRVRATTLAFVVLHQYGHLAYRNAAAEAAFKHDGADGEEERADAFALEVMKRNSETPAGLLMLIHGMLYLPATGTKAHPVSERRLHAMADYLDVHAQEFAQGRPDRRVSVVAMRSLASHLRYAAKFMADDEGQRLWAEQGRQATVASLGPRRAE